MDALPEIDPASPLQFVIHAASGSSDAQAKREVVEATLRAAGRRGDLLFCGLAGLPGVSHQAATKMTTCSARQATAASPRSKPPSDPAAIDDRLGAEEAAP